MATTTATVSISSDIQPGQNLSINASSTLMQTGLTTGLEVMDMGANTCMLGDDDQHLALHESLPGPLGAIVYDTANYVYLCNKSTDDTYYIEVGLHDTIIGHLYAGDWMFMPWNMSDVDAEISIEAKLGNNKYEYAIFKTSYELPASSQA